MLASRMGRKQTEMSSVLEYDDALGCRPPTAEDACCLSCRQCSSWSLYSGDFLVVGYLCYIETTFERKGGSYGIAPAFKKPLEHATISERKLPFQICYSTSRPAASGQIARCNVRST